MKRDAETMARCLDQLGLICKECKQSRPLHYYEASMVKNRNRNKTQLCNACKTPQFCTRCAEWKPKTMFRNGADCCNVCQLIKCASCGEDKEQTQYTKKKVFDFFYEEGEYPLFSMSPGWCEAHEGDAQIIQRSILCRLLLLP